MLIKEYRIPMPMSVEEYRIAQLYMIQKKSREESCGEGSGVEILENKPYSDGPGGIGQYTHKVYHIGMHIPSWFRSILPKAALRVEEESWNAYPYTRTRYTCPFVEKFSIDIETYYKPDTGSQADVFNLSAADKRQRTIDPIDIVTDPIPPHEYKLEEDPRIYKSAKTQRGPLLDNWIEDYNNNPGKTPIMCAYKLCKVEFRYWGMQSKIERFIHDVGLRKVMVRAHRQAWCWQDEWYGLTMEDIRQLELETQLTLAKKMAQFSQAEEATEANGGTPSPDKEQEAKEAISSIEAEEVVVRSPGETLQPRGVLTKQWSTSSRSSRSSKRGASPSRHSLSEWRMQSIARDSEDSSDEEFFDAHEDLSEGEEIFPKEIAKWNSNDLMDKIEAADAEEAPGGLFKEMTVDYERAATEDRLDEMRGTVRDQANSSPIPTITVTRHQSEASSQQCLQPSKIHVLILVLHGGRILDTGGGDQSSKQADVNTISTAFDTVMRVHYPAALGRIAIRLVPCPAICAEAFSLVSNLSPYSYDEGCLSSSQDHIPLAALPLLATSSPQYQEAVAAVIVRANQVFNDFIKSLDGATFSGQVCLIGDCVGGILGFDALCSSNQTVNESQNSSRRGSIVSVQDQDLLSPGIIINCGHGSSSPTLEGSRHLSRSNIDIPRASTGDDPKRQLPRKRSDSSTYELDTIKQHQAFLSSLHSSVLRSDAASRRSSSSTMLDGGSLGKFDFEVSDFFLFGSPLGLVLALRKTVIPMLDVAQLRPACQQVYNLFHPADPSASRLEPLLERKFHLLPPFNVPRYQRFPLGDGNSALLVETVQSNTQLLLDSGPPLSLRCQETISETCIPVPVLNWQEGSLKATPATMDSDVVQSHGGVFMDSSYPSSPVTGPFSRGQRRSSEVSIASQVSGMADSYTATNIANTISSKLNTSKSFSLLSQLALTSQNKFFLKSPPKSRKKAVVPAVPDEADPVEVLECDPETCDDLSPSAQYENCPSAGLDSAICDLVSLDSQAEVEQVAARWWGTKRLDFALYCPDALTAFPTVALPHLFHASYWESTDVVSFLLRQVMRHENPSILELDGKEVSEFTPSKPREKWLRKRTHVKIRNVTANHRVNDAVFTEDSQQVVTGRFMYGPLDMVTLAGEKVDLHIMTQPPSGEWVYFNTEVTNSSGRVSFLVPEDKRLGIGVYPVKMVVRGDHTFADSYLTVIPRGTEFVVFSIDGSFAASVSIMGSDPKVRAGAVDVVRHWQDLGYLIIYVTGRPDMQKQRVVAWLSQHNFPHGIVSFCDGLVHDPLRHKANFLKSLTEAHMKIFAGYGSTKDISVYTSIGLPSSQIYIVGRPTKKMQHQCQFITEGYAAHLSLLEYNHRSRPAKSSSARMVLRKSSFGLGANSDFLRKRNHLLRTISSQPSPTSPTGSLHNRPERTQSQSDSERLERERLDRAYGHSQGATQRSMSITASCWGRSSSTKLDPGILSPK
ncbi:membrane-associated phosphatidylinositol transfer protein 2-like isoform X1 [Synchiropus splendidus]|uniref:membrane-associated phosphatidylinositol transfer protein 2-like isoform X1 n=1 Tax=Synchiropus splendidus TaxID=270530 RepID=UPI00237D81E1|nr:membrane-associated phosphatidylinositol transfer protein 2-like isoform X1 [Synchiropus splendidus]XP_053726035.1 membrane-associated phosphatidylinositol transfer protein 2-like isoform X1 [Synchiropus splendidus]XP_053726036.1 membrane-associated phosphatidylinositol transfer protein 2-like isoform X1 [Synchiropus splendidus]XP_053726037.1 membrane-associated phosphatidylinositol transfer protein 2-like isoform X1 [Synchiropus splendidus]